ncbi:glutaredoxin domain-containing protein, partial [Ligilactobacillus salivarius]
MTTVSSSNVVTVYSKNNCQQCKITKRKLHSMGIDYHEYNVDEDPKALDYLLERGLRSLPVVVTEDDTW